jgi:hypothetical protein
MYFSVAQSDDANGESGAITGTLNLAPDAWTPGAVRIAWSIIVLGALARLLPYIGNRSLWLDEAHVALVIARHSLLGLVHHIDSGERGAVLFLISEKGATKLLGLNEFGLRLVPLLASVLSLVLLYQVVGDACGRRHR